MTRWQQSEASRGDDYDARWRKLAASGKNIHGWADLVESSLRESGGTSRWPATGGMVGDLATPTFRGRRLPGLGTPARNPTRGWPAPTVFARLGFGYGERAVRGLLSMRIEGNRR